MGTMQSVTITPQKPDHDGKQIKKDDANGHVFSDLDLIDAENCKSSVKQNIEPPPVSASISIKPIPASVEANGHQGKASGKQAIVTTESAEQTLPAESSTPSKDTPKQVETNRKFSNMFKKKIGPLSGSAEVEITPAVETDSQKSNPKSASVEINGPQAAAIQISATTESAEQKLPAESSSPAKDTPKQVETNKKFSSMFKKKIGPVSGSAEVAIVPAAATYSQKSNPKSASVEINGPQAAAIQISATTESAEQKLPAESNSPAKDTPKQVETNKKFSNMFKKKIGPVSGSAEVAIVPVETDSQNSNPKSASVEINGPQAAAIQISATTESAEQKLPAESSSPAKDTPKQVETNKIFSNMFKKKIGPVSGSVEVVIVPEVDNDGQKSNPKPASVEINGPQAAAIQISAKTESAEQKLSAESSSPAKDTPKQVETNKKFSNMFKKKIGPVSGSAEVDVAPTAMTNSQNSNPKSASVTISGPQAAAIQISATTESAEQKRPAESSSPAKDTPKQVETNKKFSNMFKKKIGPVSGSAELAIVPAIDTDSQKSIPKAASVEVNGPQAESAEQKLPAESSTPTTDTPKQVETNRKFSNMFKKKTGPVSPAPGANVAAEVEIVSAVELDSQKTEPTGNKASTQAKKEPQGEASNPSTTEVTQDSTQPEQTSTEDNSVMNFFKTLVTSTKTTKEASTSPDVSHEQSPKATPQAPIANEASKIPPPPPPAPPKMETKAEPAVKKEEAPPVQAAASTPKESETKSKSKDSPFSKLFRTKALLGKKVSKVQVSTAGGARVPAKTSSAVDASKTSTLEASAKLEPAQAPKPEEKKAEKKPSPFANLLKPKVLLGQVSSKIHAAASSAAASISLGAEGAAEPKSKKETSATPTAPAEVAPSTKAKEEPKPAAASAAASPENKSMESTDSSSPSSSRKLEKRNSIQLFFKNLGQKRHSDAGVQTEPVAPEKAK